MDRHPRRRSVALLLAAGVILAAALTFVVLFPRFECKGLTRLRRDIPRPAGSPNGWVCMRSDVGYVPYDRAPLRYGVVLSAIVVSGVLIGIAVRRQPSTGAGPTASSTDGATPA